MANDFDPGSRLRVLDALRVMGSPPEERFDRITRMARELFGVPVAEIHFLDDTILFTKSPQEPNWPVSYPRKGTFCDATLQKKAMLVIRDLGVDPMFSTHENVVGAPHVRFYAGRPLSVDDGLPLGTICLLDFVPRELSVEQRVLLDEFGQWVERELRHSADRDRASEVQVKMFPAAVRHPDGYDLAGLSIPRMQIAGDFYTWRICDRSIDMTLVDVMGKGTAATILAASVRSAFHARAGEPPAEVVAAVNTQLHGDFAATETFAALFHGRLELKTGRLEFVDAGHGLTVLIRADGSFQRLASLGLPLGIADDGGWLTQTVDLKPGDSLVSFTDGVLDLYDGTLHSLTQVTDLVRTSASTDEFFSAVRLLAASGQVTDDITVLVVTRR